MHKFPLSQNLDMSDVEDRRGFDGKPNPGFDMNGQRLPNAEQQANYPSKFSTMHMPATYRDGMYEDATGNWYPNIENWKRLHMMNSGSRPWPDPSDNRPVVPRRPPLEPIDAAPRNSPAP